MAPVAQPQRPSVYPVAHDRPVERADVAVVGVGVTGALVAHACRERGFDVLMLEAEDLSAGASVVRGEAVFLPEEIARLEALAGPIVERLPWEPTMARRGSAPPGVSTGLAAWQSAALTPEQGGPRDGLEAATVDTNRLAVSATLAAIRGGARLALGEFVSSVESQDDGFLLTATSRKVLAHVVVDTTGAEGLTGSHRWLATSPTADEVQWLRIRRTSQTVVTLQEVSDVDGWAMAPHLTHSWVFFPHCRTLELDRDLYGSERHMRMAWRSPRPVEAKTGFFFPPGTHVGSAPDMAHHLADAVAELRTPSEPRQTLPLFVAGSESARGAMLCDRYPIPAWLCRRLDRFHGPDAEATLRETASRLVCPCAGIVLSELRHAVQHEEVRTLEDLARRVDLGEGLCNGIRCSRIAALELVEAGKLEPAAMAPHAAAFMERRKAVHRESQPLSPQQAEWAALAECYGGQA